MQPLSYGIIKTIMKAPSVDELLKELKDMSPPLPKEIKTKEVVTKKEHKLKKNPHIKRRLYTRLSEDKKKKLLLQAFDLYATGLTYQQIALKLGVPATTMFEILSSDASFEYVKNLKSKAIAIKFLDDIEANRQAQAKLRDKATFSQLGTDIGIKWDKVHPPNQVAQQFNIGNRKIEVVMPKFFKPRR